MAWQAHAPEPGGLLSVDWRVAGLHIAVGFGAAPSGGGGGIAVLDVKVLARGGSWEEACVARKGAKKVRALALRSR